jgi:hypothetical protein
MSGAGIHTPTRGLRCSHAGISYEPLFEFQPVFLILRLLEVLNFRQHQPHPLCAVGKTSQSGLSLSAGAIEVPPVRVLSR